MSVWKGDNLTMELYGSSHGEEIGVRLKGLPSFPLDLPQLNAFLARRKANGAAYSTARKEPDEPIFREGLLGGVLAGDVHVVIRNTDVKSGDYDQLQGKPRPSHADYCAYLKDGRTDFRGGGRFSGRMTAPLCVAGGIARQYLERSGVHAAAYLSQVGQIKGRSYKDGGVTFEEVSSALAQGHFALSRNEEMLTEAEDARQKGDSVGAVVECVVFAPPPALGNALFDSVEGKISSLLFAVPAVKGVEFGDGFSFAGMRGSVANDPWRYENGKVVAATNRAGGINGGITNGMPLCLSVVFRPTPSISLPQKTVDLINKTDCDITIAGRHDACVAFRALPAVESAVMLALTDIMIGGNK